MTTLAKPTTCVIADDHEVIVRYLSEFVRSIGVEVVGTATSGKEALELLIVLRPTIAIVDVRMPELSGLDIVRETARTAPEVGVILYTGYSDHALLADALPTGVRGIVRKEGPFDDIGRAVRAVADGREYIDPVLAGDAASRQHRGRTRRLTPREREILGLLAQGQRNDAIATRLSISAETVQSHVHNAMQRLDADTRTQAVALAIRQELID